MTSRAATRQADELPANRCKPFAAGEHSPVTRPWTPRPRPWSEARNISLLSCEPKMARAVGQVGAVDPARCRRASPHATTSHSSHRHERDHRRASDVESVLAALAFKQQSRRAAKSRPRSVDV